MKMRLILFDIDQTLVDMAGVGMRCLRRAFREVCKAELEGVVPDGRTDPAILREGLAIARIPPGHWADLERKCLAYYVEALEAELAVPDSGRHLKPGVQLLLDTLSQADWARLGLLTGNLESTARLKLRSLGIEHYFPVGGFASDCSNRCNLGPVALERARRFFRVPLQPSQVWVVGDTTHDVQAAHALGARALAVASGRYPVPALEESRPAAVLADLSDLDRVLQILQS
jgi:phosphoglycolate phosphatase-like HAD superfamily hydrolase